MWLQNMGTYSNQLPVVVGYKNAAIVKWLRKISGKDAQKTIDVFASTGRPRPDETAFTFIYDERMLLWLGWDWHDTPEDLATLVHETNHVVYETVRDKGMVNECEAQAYLQEYLFCEIRKKLGVKSKSKRGRHGRNTSHRKLVGLRHLQPGKKESPGTEASKKNPGNNDGITSAS